MMKYIDPKELDYTDAKKVSSLDYEELKKAYQKVNSRLHWGGRYGFNENEEGIIINSIRVIEAELNSRRQKSK